MNKKIICIFALVLSACSVQGVLVRSQGQVDGWEETGYRNRDIHLELVFVPNNAYYDKINEVVAGVTLRKNLPIDTSNIGKSRFKIEVRFKAFHAGYYLNPNFMLTMDDHEFYPEEVLLGYYSLATGCSSLSAIKLKNIEVLSAPSDGYQCLIIEYGFLAPPPEKTFSLSIEGYVDEVIDEIKVSFSPVVSSVYYH